MAAPRSTTSPTSLRPEREFGFAVGAVLCAIGGWWLFRGRFPGASAAALGVGALLLLLGAFLPGALSLPRRLWMGLAEALSFVMTRLVLAVVFFGLVTPVGILRRALGRDPLRRRGRAAAESYWFPYSARQADVRHFEKMY